MRQAYVVILVIVLGIVAGLAFSYYKDQLFPPSSTTYSLGEEIKGYPAEELATTFTQFRTTYPEDKPDRCIVYVDFTLRNIANREIDLWELEISSDLLLNTPLLKYGDYYATYGTSINPKVWLIDGLKEVSTEQEKSMMPNQSFQGALEYEIAKGYSPSALVYPDPNAENAYNDNRFSLSLNG